MMRRGPVVAAVAGVALILLMVVALILPKASQIRSKQNEVATAVEREQSLQAQLAGLQDDQKDAKKTRRELSRIEGQIPPLADLPGLIKTLDAKVAETGLDFMSLAPGQPTLSPSGTLSVLPMQVTLIGGFFAVDQFLGELEDLPRVNRITTLTLTAGPDGLPQLQVVATAEFYTTDLSAGPGSAPGSTTQVPGAADATAPSPAPATGEEAS